MSRSNPDQAEPTPLSRITGAQVCVDMFDSMDEEEQKFLGQVAEVVRMQFDNFGAEAAGDYLKTQRLQGEEMVALWSLLGSKVRSALKKVGAA